MNWAMKLPIKFKINMYNGVKYSKWILRKAYEDVIPKDIIWRPKAPLEQGTGTETLRTYFNDMITDKEFAEKKKAIKAADDVKSKTKNNYSTTSTSERNSANQKTFSPKSKAASNVQNARATLKPNSVLQNLRSIPNLIFFLLFFKNSVYSMTFFGERLNSLF